MPDDGHCDDCGSCNIVKSGDLENFEKELQAYHIKKEQLCGFYNQIGNLVDFELRNGYESYDALKMEVQHNIKH